MADHILGPRARFWLALVDLANALHLPWGFVLWLIGRAGKAVCRQRERMSEDDARRPF